MLCGGFIYAVDKSKISIKAIVKNCKACYIIYGVLLLFLNPFQNEFSWRNILDWDDKDLNIDVYCLCSIFLK